MIRRHTSLPQQVALGLINGLPLLNSFELKTLGVAQQTLRELRHEKLAVTDDHGVYALTDAGKEAMETGLYLKQPILLSMPESPKAKPVLMKFMGKPNGRSA